MSGESDGDDEGPAFVGALRLPLWRGDDALGEAAFLYAPDPAERAEQVRAAGLGALLVAYDVPPDTRAAMVAKALGVAACDVASTDVREVLAAHVAAFVDLAAFLDCLGDVDGARFLSDADRALLWASREAAHASLGGLLVGWRAWERGAERRAIGKAAQEVNTAKAAEARKRGARGWHAEAERVAQDVWSRNPSLSVAAVAKRVRAELSRRGVRSADGAPPSERTVRRVLSGPGCE